MTTYSPITDLIVSQRGSRRIVSQDIWPRCISNLEVFGRPCLDSHTVWIVHIDCLWNMPTDRLVLVVEVWATSCHLEHAALYQLCQYAIWGKRNGCVQVSEADLQRSLIIVG
jgi:hypothetical protein